MSWMNNSFQQLSSITGQISNFTREVLADQDDSEAVEASEVEKLKRKLLQLQQLAQQREDEVQNLKEVNSQLQTKYQSNEHRTRSLLEEYQLKLEQQNQTIEKLKVEHQQQQGSATDDDIGGYHVIVHQNATSSDASSSNDDVIKAQQDKIQQLFGKIEKLEEELKNANIKLSNKVDDENGTGWKSEYLKLEVELKKNKENFDELRRKYEIAQNQIKESQQPQQELVHIKIEGLSNEIDELNEKLKTKNCQIQAQKNTIDELELKLATRPVGSDHVKVTDDNNDVMKNNQDAIRLIEGLLAILPQLSGKQSTDDDVIDDIIDTVVKLQQNSTTSEDKNSHSSFSYECLDSDDVNIAVADEKGIKGETSKKRKSRRYGQQHHQNRDVIDEICDEMSNMCQQEDAVTNMIVETMKEHQLKTNEMRKEMAEMSFDESSDDEDDLTKQERTTRKPNIKYSSSAFTELQVELKTARKHLQAEKDEHSVTRLQLQEDAKKKEELEKRFDSVVAELETSKLEAKEANEALETLDEQHTEEMSQILLIRGEQDEKIEQINKQLANKKEESKELEIKLKTLENNHKNTVNVLEEQIKSLKESNKLKRESSETDKKLIEELQNELHESQQLMELLKAQVSEKFHTQNLDLENQLDKSRRETNELNARLQEVEEEWKADVAAKKDRINQLESDVAGLNHAKTRLENEIELIREDGLDVERVLNDDLKLAREQIQQANEARLKLKSEVKSKTDENKELSSVVEDREQQNSILRAEIDKLKKQIDSKLSKEKLTTSDPEESIQNVRQGFEQEIAALKAEIGKREAKLKQEAENERTLQARLEESLESISSLKESNEKYLKEMEEEKGEISTLQAQVQQISEEKDDFQTQLRAAKQRVDELESDSNKTSESQKSKFPDNIEAIFKQTADLSIEGLEKSEVSKEDVGRLLDFIKERDQIIKFLSAKNGELENEKNIKQATVVEKPQLEVEEKDQMLSIISEKTRENRQLKDEARKMMDAIATNNQLVKQLRDENAKYREQYEGLDQGMTKETVKNLSKLISEKDFEIESLKQKCQTLLDVLQQQDNNNKDENSSNTAASYSSQQIETLMKERETLSAQVRQLVSDRNQLVTLVQTKHEEALKLHQEASKVAQLMEKDAAENSKLQICYTNLVFDYDQLQLKLNSHQRELDRIKELTRELQNSKTSIVSRMHGGTEEGEIASTPPGETPSSSAAQGIVSDDQNVQQLQQIIEKKSESLIQKDLLVQDAIRRSNESENKVNELSRENREKDHIIKRGADEIEKLSKELNKKLAEVSILKKSVENLREQISELNELRMKVEDLEKKVREKDSETEAFRETNAQLAMRMKGQAYEQENLKEQVVRLETILKQNKQGKETETEKYLKEIEKFKNEATNAMHEKDQFMLSLKQKQIETQRYSEELRQLQDKEKKQNVELTRLRTHLVEVEESYTNEAVQSELREKQLTTRLEEEASRSERAIKSQEQTRHVVDNLQLQLQEVVQQRDKTVHQYQLAQEKIVQYSQMISQLKSAAERMQRDEAATYAAQVARINKQLKLKQDEVDEKAKQLQQVQAKLDEVNEALELATRLSEQLELKEEDLERTRQIVNEKQTQIEELQNSLSTINARNENMVDRQLVKNLFIGYFSSVGKKQQEQVITLITSMIGFSKEEMDRLNPRRNQGWMGGLLSWGGGPPAHTAHGGNNKMNESFTEMFVKFLEEESQSKPDAAKLPANKMALETQQKSQQRRKLSTTSSTNSIPSAPTNDVGTISSLPSDERGSGVAGHLRYNSPLTFSTSANFAPTFIKSTTSGASGTGGSEQNILQQGILNLMPKTSAADSSK